MRIMVSGEIETIINQEAQKRGVLPATMVKFVLNQWADSVTLLRTKRGRGRPPAAAKASEVSKDG